jgi:hypothetical protein
VAIRRLGNHDPDTVDWIPQLWRATQWASASFLDPDQTAALPSLWAFSISSSDLSLENPNCLCRTLETYSIVFTGSSHMITDQGDSGVVSDSTFSNMAVSVTKIV